MSQATIRDGRRMSTAECYLDPARKSANLTIETDAMTDSLLFEGHRCIRRAIHKPQLKTRGPAAREVIVSAGSIESPTAAGAFRHWPGAATSWRLGIEVRHDLPGVGENLRDHWAPRMKWRVGRRGVTFNERARGYGALWQGFST